MVPSVRNEAFIALIASRAQRWIGLSEDAGKTYAAQRLK